MRQGCAALTSVRRRGYDPEDLCPSGARIAILVRDTALEGQGVPSLQPGVVVANPEVELASDHHHAFLVGIVGIRLVSRTTARVDPRPDHLPPAVEAYIGRAS